MPLHAGNLASGPYYTEAVKALRGNRHACNLLGEPMRFQALKLGDQENRVTTEHAQVDYGDSGLFNLLSLSLSLGSLVVQGLD